jgi:Glutaredoxin-like domain (DUF836)
VARITLLGRPGCHLCDDARAVIERVAADVGTDWEERDITTSPDDMAEYWDKIPVTFVDGMQIDFWRISETRLRKALTQPASPSLRQSSPARTGSVTTPPPRTSSARRAPGRRGLRVAIPVARIRHLLCGTTHIVTDFRLYKPPITGQISSGIRNKRAAAAAANPPHSRPPPSFLPLVTRQDTFVTRPRPFPAPICELIPHVRRPG